MSATQSIRSRNQRMHQGDLHGGIRPAYGALVFNRSRPDGHLHLRDVC